MERGILGGAVMGAVLVFVAVATAAPPRVGTVVQLPTFNFFTVATTVEVPDSGGGSLGGIGTADSVRIDRGIPGLGFRPFTNTDFGLARGGGNVSVQAEIQDLDAMDHALLGNGASSQEEIALRKLPLVLRPAAGEAQRRSSPLAADSAGSQSIAEMRRQQSEADSAAQQSEQREAQRLFDQASELQAAGKPGVAKVYYRMAARRATGSLRDRAIAALRELSSSTPAVSADR
jgi:hypothetical protein